MRLFELKEAVWAFMPLDLAKFLKWYFPVGRKFTFNHGITDCRKPDIKKHRDPAATKFVANVRYCHHDGKLIQDNWIINIHADNNSFFLDKLAKQAHGY